MRERPIIFSAPMVRAILDGKKTQTRRVVKPQPVRVAEHMMPLEDGGQSAMVKVPDGWRWRDLYGADNGGKFADALAMYGPYGAPGDRLWVREGFALAPSCNDPEPDNSDDWHVVYRADGDDLPWLSGSGEDATEVPAPWRPSIFMPRWASRITLEIINVRVQRVQDIGEEDARAEGVDGPHYGRWTDMTGAVVPPLSETARPWAHSFAVAWREVHRGDDASWFTNPWVWALTFKRVEQPR